MTDYTLKVSRKLMAIGKPARVQSEYNSIDRTMHLSDDVRWQMGGDEVAFFSAQVEETTKQITLLRRVPDPKWGPKDYNI